MGAGLKDSGEEKFVKRIFRDDQITNPSTVDLLLFSDSTDAIGDGGDLSSVTTEPSGTYARKTVSLNTTSIVTSINASSNWFSSIADQQFDTSSLASSQSVDAYGTVGNYDADGDVLLWTGDLDQSYDLNSIDTFTLQDSGLILD